MEIINLRVGLIETINDLNNLLNNIDDAQQQRDIMRLLKVKNALLDAVVTQEIDRNSATYKKALKALIKAEKATKDGVADVQKVAKAIERASKAARAVGRVVGLGISFLA